MTEPSHQRILDEVAKTNARVGAVEVTVGKLEEKAIAAEKHRDEMTVHMKRQTATLTELKSWADQGRGGLKVLLTLGGAIAVVAGLVTSWWLGLFK